MEHLTNLDAGFLEAEDSDRHVSLAVGALSILEGPMPAIDTILGEVAHRIADIPRLHQVLRTHLLDLGPPEWADDPHFDITHHIRHAALPSPGDDDALNQFVGDVMGRRLDRDRPLWECWIVEGLADDRWALLIKIHHCIADGIATMHLFSRLVDSAHTPGYDTDIRAARQSTRTQWPLSEWGLNPLRWARGVGRAAISATQLSALAVGGAVQVTSGILRPAQTSSLNGPVSAMRRFSAGVVRLSDVARICDSYGVTVNDVALAAITNSYRAALERRGETPRRTSLRTLVPVSIRSNHDAGSTDNRVSLMLPALPADTADPVEQLQAVHRRLSRAKGSGQREAGGIFVALSNMIPFPVTAWAVRAFTRLPQRGIVTLATNVPGPRERMTILGRSIIRVLPIPPIAMRLRTGVAILTYADEVVFGILGDYDAAADVDQLAAGIESAVETLAATADRRAEE
ncbi:wax ester/triacylglycerol synthase family O-acyltransferase [Mycolicibacterium sp. 3033]|nr:wax ester/triacylglycerol synthase family O-acyltransferase [Mycolicibacterium aurantiacum]